MKTILLRFQIFKKQIVIYYRLQKNYLKFTKNKTPYFYVFTMPIFGYFFSLIARAILQINSEYLIKKILSSKIFLSTLRFLTPIQRLKISKFLPSYNDYKEKIELNDSIGNKKSKVIYSELIKDGISDLGLIFSKQDCENFINHLNKKVCFNSQVKMQSDGVPHCFDLNKDEFNDKKNSYFCFEEDTNISFEPLKLFLENKDLIKLVNTYLGFRASIYLNSTWYNQVTDKFHYVHRLHRDYDDFKFLGITIYWNDVSELSAPLGFVKKSHLDPEVTEPISIITGSAGTVLITDTFALHKGNPTKKHRYTSTIRFGKPFNTASVNNGFLLS